MTSRFLPIIAGLALLSAPAVADDTVAVTNGAPLVADAFSPDFGFDLGDAVAQDEDEEDDEGGNRTEKGDDDDDLGDILGTAEESVSEERKAVEEGRIDGQAGVRGKSALETPEDAAERGTLCGIALHIVKAAMLQDCRPEVIRHLNAEECRDPGNFCGQIGL